MKTRWIIIGVITALVAGFGFTVWPGPQKLGYDAVVEPSVIQEKAKSVYGSVYSRIASYLPNQESDSTPSSVVEAQATEEPQSQVNIATINAPDSAVVGEEFSVNWDCPNASLAMINQKGEDVLEPSGSVKFTVTTAGDIDFVVSCTWPNGETNSSTKTTHVVVFESATEEVDCSLTDGTAQIKVEQVGDEYIVDPANLEVVDGYNNTLPGHDVTNLSGCDMWSEYEGDRVHVIDVLRDDPSKELSYLGDDGKYHFPSPMGGSFWVGPSDWNTADFSTEKPSIALEMASAKDINQQRNGYDWPEVIRLPDLTFRTYEVGHEYGDFYSGCVDLETSPAPVNVAGTIVEGGYNASIGIEGCLIAVKLDDKWTYWADARDNVVYTTSASAYLFKKGTTKEEVQEWIDSQ